MALLAPLPGRLLERRGNASPRGMAAGQLRLPHRTRLIGGLPIPPCRARWRNASTLHVQLSLHILSTLFL